MLLYSKVFINK